MTAPTVWIPVALSSEIEAGASAGAVVDGKEVVVWRDTSGKAHAWEDRCPHRGMRMSFGFVRGDHIACLYHGWQYDTAGQCQYIPAHPDLDVPQTIKVMTYATKEATASSGRPCPKRFRTKQFPAKQTRLPLCAAFTSIVRPLRPRGAGNRITAWLLGFGGRNRFCRSL